MAMKREYPPSKRVPVDPLERAEENALAYRDLARAEARRNSEHVPSEVESTARVPAIHVHMHSEHEIDEPAPKASGKAWQVALATIVTAGLAWLAQWLGSKTH
jgi:hypothetical protein